MFKNTASQKWIVFAFDETDNSAKTGDAAQITANIRIDGGGANAVDDTNPTELEGGYYVFDITAAETNGDYVLICPASSTSDIQVIGCPAAVFTRPPYFNALSIESDGDLTQVNTLDGHTVQTGDSYAIVNGDHGLVSIQDDVDDILADTNELQTNQGKSFHNGMVWVNEDEGTASTAFPYGTATGPTDTIARAVTIGTANNINRIHIAGGFTLGAALERYSLYSNGHYDTGDVVAVNGQSIARSTFESIIISGASGSGAAVTAQTRYLDCLISAHTNLNGAALECAIDGACSIVDTGYAWLRNCRFGLIVPCTLTVQAPSAFSIDNPKGTLILAGMDGGTGNIQCDTPFDLTIAASCTGGTLNIYGEANITNSTGGTTVNVIRNPVNAVEVGGTTQTALDINDILTDTGTTLPATLSTIDGKLDTIDNFLDTEVAAILEDTGTTLPATLSTMEGKIDTVDTVVDAIQAKTDLQPAGVQKNVALSNFTFIMVDDTDGKTPETGLTITATISKDGGAFASCTNSASEISNGFYKINLTQTEMNADFIVLSFSSSGARTASIALTTSS